MPDILVTLTILGEHKTICVKNEYKILVITRITTQRNTQELHHFVLNHKSRLSRLVTGSPDGICSTEWSPRPSVTSRWPSILPVLQSNFTSQPGAPVGWFSGCIPAHSTLPTSFNE